MGEKGKDWALARIAYVAGGHSQLGDELAYIRLIAEAALSKEPDVVVLLRWCNDVTPWHGYHKEFAQYIEAIFHVHLTEDGGWQWVEGKE